MALRRLGYIFIPVLAIILMSHNVFAVNADKYVNSGVYGYNGPGSSMIFGGNTIYGSAVESNSLSFEMMSGAATQNVSNFFLRMNGTVPANSIYYFTMTTCSVYDYGSNYKVFGLAFRGDFAVLQTDLGEQYLASGTNKYCRQYAYKLYSTAANFGIQGVASRHIQVTANTNLVVNFSPVSWIQLGQDADYTSALQSISNKQSQTNQKLDTLNQQNSEYYDKQYDSIDSIDNQSAGDISGTDNQNTTNLIGVFSSFVTALGNASSTNCNFSGDFGNLDIGQLNFCHDDPPTIVQVIGSLVLIAVFVPLAYFLVNRIISEIRSFTNG